MRERLFELAKPQNGLLFLRIVGIDLLVAIMLRFMQPRDILGFLSPSRDKKDRTINPSETYATSQDRIGKIVRYTDFLIKHKIPILRGACLKRSLMLYRFFRKEGLPVVVNIGVAKENGSLIGHSWLTMDDSLYFETEEQVERFRCVLSYPAPDSR